ncbi:hypothetical protein [Ruminococcus sp.]|uniref:hypothetical protein n=1 Tax=Ruminococcus sp. TaxID=41978 RepID=UPI003868988E
MKITSFSSLIMTNDAENAGKVFETLGFTKKHEKKDASENHDSGFRMKDADGHGIRSLYALSAEDRAARIRH